MTNWNAHYVTEVVDGEQVYVCECGYEAGALSELAVHDERRHGDD